jgi:5-methylthioadenosine/S-adenosylhomocysteine deaminase
MKTLIKNTLLLPMTEEKKVITNTNIGITDDKISFIGEIPVDFTADKIIDGSEHVVMPGLVNSHTHIAMSLLRNYADDLPFWDWLFGKILPVEEKFTEEHIYYGSLLSAAEMIQGGTTCFNDMYFMMEMVAKATEESGMRAILGRGIAGDLQQAESGFSEMETMLTKWHKTGDGRILISIAPHAIYTCPPETLEKCLQWAKEKNLILHTHVSESKKEADECFQQHGKSPVRYLRDLGLFDVHAAAAHCVQLDEADCEILCEKRVHVLHNPISNMKLANGFAPLKMLMEKGVNIALGTDGAASNNSQNMWKEIQIASLLSKGIHQEPTMIPAYEALKMATCNGAKALGLEKEIGSLEVGKKADLILVNLDKPHLQPLHDVISTLVYSAQASDVETVIINGKIVMENRSLKTLDYPTLKRKVRELKKELIKG